MTASSTDSHCVLRYALRVYEFETGPRRLAIVRLRGQITREDLDRMIADTDAFLAEAASFAILYDISDAELPPREEVMRVLGWVQAARHRVQETYDRAVPPIPYFSAYYMPSMLGNLLRFFLQMIPSLRGQQIVCETAAQGLAACEEALDRMAFGLPDGHERPTG